MTLFWFWGKCFTYHALNITFLTKTARFVSWKKTVNFAGVLDMLQSKGYQMQDIFPSSNIHAGEITRAWSMWVLGADRRKSIFDIPLPTSVSIPVRAAVANVLLLSDNTFVFVIDEGCSYGWGCSNMTRCTCSGTVGERGRVLVIRSPVQRLLNYWDRIEWLLLKTTKECTRACAHVQSVSVVILSKHIFHEWPVIDAYMRTTVAVHCRWM